MIWRGEQYRGEGIRQLESYMAFRNAEEGYLVSFSFTKIKKDTCGWISEQETDKSIFEVIVS